MVWGLARLRERSVWIMGVWRMMLILGGMGFHMWNEDWGLRILCIAQHRRPRASTFPLSYYSPFSLARTLFLRLEDHGDEIKEESCADGTKTQPAAHEKGVGWWGAQPSIWRTCTRHGREDGFSHFFGFLAFGERISRWPLAWPKALDAALVLTAALSVRLGCVG